MSQSVRRSTREPASDFLSIRDLISKARSPHLLHIAAKLGRILVSTTRTMPSHQALSSEGNQEARVCADPATSLDNATPSKESSWSVSLLAK